MDLTKKVADQKADFKKRGPARKKKKSLRIL